MGHTERRTRGTVGRGAGLALAVLLAPCGCPTPDPPANLLHLADADRILWGHAEDARAGAGVAAGPEGQIALGAPYTPSSDGAVPDAGTLYLARDAGGLPADAPLEPGQSTGVDHVTGNQPYGALGFALALGADLDGSGVVDLVVGSPGAPLGGDDEAAGQIRIHLDVDPGGRGEGDADVSLAGPAGRMYMGYALAAGASAAGDEHDDLLIGAPETYGEAPYAEGDDGPGRAFLLLGRADLQAGLAEAGGIADADGVIEFIGEAEGEATGMSVALVAGPDPAPAGTAAVVIGAPYSSRSGAYAGAAYLCLDGAWTGGETVPVGSECITYVGETGDHAGFAVAAAGDVDGSGHGDLLVGAPQLRDDSGDQGAGRVYLVTDALADPERRTVDLTSGAATVFEGAMVGDMVGFSVAGGEDLDGDGLDDLILGAPQGAFQEPEYYKGAAYLFLGREDGFADQVPVGTATLQLCGEQFDPSGGTIGDMAGYDLAVGNGWMGSADAAFVAIGAPRRANDRHEGDWIAGAGAVYLLHDALEPHLSGGFGPGD